MARSRVPDGLWQEFHRVVNMTSRELADWLRVDSSGEVTEALPDLAGPTIGMQVLGILAKRRADLTEDDIAVMETVIDQVHAARRDDLESTQGDMPWRHHLMSLGHDPLKHPEVVQAGAERKRRRSGHA